jgi:pimeloyl-ACP methyl ester carboxylesterase
MRSELITIPTATTPLDGVLYEPEAGARVGAVLFFHGNTMNFYVGAPRFMPPALTALGFTCLTFNRRGHDILGVRNSRAAEGAAFQLTQEGIDDNRTAAQWLAGRGFANPVIIGHSNGGMLGVRHVVDHPQTPALVLLSAGRGGISSMQEGSSAGLLAGDGVDELTAKARALVHAGRGRELMFMPGWWYVISAESFLDRMTEVPDTLALAPQVKCPVLCIRGDEESRERYPAEEFQSRAGGHCDVEIVANCDHFYNGREDVVTDIVANWLAKTLNVSRRA